MVEDVPHVAGRDPRLTPSPFRYARPRSLEEAVALLHDRPTETRILAGGQSLVPLLAQRILRPRVVLDINHIADLDQIVACHDHIRMGALVRQEQARVSPVVRTEIPGLSQALDWVASPVIRARGTVVGNLVANAPGSELPAVAIALGARFGVRDFAGQRLVEARDVLGSGRSLAPDALVTHVLWPRNPGRGGFYEVARRLGAAPVVGAMVSVGTDGARVGLCGVAAVGVACPSVADAIHRRFPAAPATAEIDRLLARDLTEPAFGTEFVGAEYRRRIAPVVIQRAIAIAGASAGADAARH
jgi:carbon-monoxide dehydrogenase medium subunit